MPRDRDKFSNDAVDWIDVTLVTADVEKADTNGDVYLTLGGREFNLKRPDLDDRKRGASDRYLLGGFGGKFTNVEHKDQNNPRDLPIILVWDHPVGLRFQPVANQNPPDAWKLADCWVSIHTVRGFEEFVWMDSGLANLWLGGHSGLTVGLELEIQDEDKAKPKHKRAEYEQPLP
jgi:hypothetical protein